jgi:hypothetical protein
MIRITDRSRYMSWIGISGFEIWEREGASDKSVAIVVVAGGV